MKRLSFFVFILIAVSLARAQDDCPALVEQALAQVGELCANLERNVACYGNTLINATDWQQTELENFAQTGDLTSIADIATLATAALSSAAGVWGIAVLSLQASLPDSLPGQNVTFVIFGDVQIESENTPETQTSEAAAFNAPMQAFRFVSGLGQPECAEAPRAGILVQAPQNLVVSLMVNGLRVDVGSTALLIAEQFDELEVFTFEGQVGLTSPEASPDASAPEGTFRPDTSAAAGFRIAGRAGERPAQPEPFAPGEFSNLPFAALPRRLQIPPFGELPTLEPITSGTVVTLSVPGNAADWVDSGVRLQPRDVFTVLATGEVSIWPTCQLTCDSSARILRYDCTQLCPNITAGPNGSLPIDGIVPESVPFFVLPGANMVALLARIGAEGTPFVVGAYATFVSAESGMLQFRVNEDTRFLGDETGAFDITLAVFGATP
ncbi:MAG: hypothetical protein HXY40_16290 [Chloroflexi bacterium]|nr:hypothetical protein [Chloroflexota bacterium]